MAKSLDEVETYIHSVYLENYESYKEEIKCPVDGQTYLVDGAKLQCLNVIFKFDLDKCYIEKSKIESAGNGLFAKKDISQGEIITFYPGDIASFLPNEDQIKPEHVSLETYSQRFKNQFEKNIKKERDANAMMNKYTYNVDKKYRIIGSPYFKDDTNYMGHFINDGSKLNPSDTSKEYLEASLLKSNCGYFHMKDLLIGIVATENIKKYEELYIPYGEEYWENYNKLQFENPDEEFKNEGPETT